MIFSNRGGRQGCKLGGTVFNFVYSRALKALREKLRLAGCTIFLGTASPEGACWTASSQSTPSFVSVASATELSESTFIDDEALYTAAASPAQLNKKCMCVLSCLVSVFRQFGFVINWSPGKTELLIKYRGAQSRDYNLKLVCPDGNNMFRVPKCIASTGLINVAQQYKHVGSLITHDLNTTADARKKCEGGTCGFQSSFGQVLWLSEGADVHQVVDSEFACLLAALLPD